MKEKISLKLARRIVLAAQGFADPRPAGPIDRRHLRRVLARLGLFQIDSVSVLVRAHYMPMFSRLGPYPLGLLEDSAGGRKRLLFEYWAHEASLLPIETWPLMRWRMRRAARGVGIYGQIARFGRERADYVERVFREIEANGPIAASGFEGHKGIRRLVGLERGQARLRVAVLGRTHHHRLARGFPALSTTCPSACCRRRSSARRSPRPRMPSANCCAFPPARSASPRQPTCATISGCRRTT